MMKASTVYGRQNRAIHQAMALIWMPYGDYRADWVAVCRQITGRSNVKGLSDLTLGERRALITHLIKRGVKVFNPPVPPAMADWQRGDAEIEAAVRSKGKQHYPGRPDIEGAGDRRRLLGKVDALLAEAKRPWTYAHHTARRMFGIERVQWCDRGKLHKLVAALEIDARRHGRR